MARKDKLSSNPVEAARKAARQRELKKNKDNREKSREFALVKKDTKGIEGEIRQLEQQRGAGDVTRLEALREELQRSKAAKEKYLKEHPEHKKFIYPHSATEQQPTQQQQRDTGTGLFRPDGKPRFPERSVYYDPVFNPWGNPPPGLPYREKPPHEWASTSGVQQDGSDDDDEDDDGIVMPAGPPPGGANGGDSDEDDSDDDIVMPAGPPPGVYSGPPPGGYSGPPPPPGGYTGPPPPPPMAFSRPPMHYNGPLPRPGPYPNGARFGAPAQSYRPPPPPGANPQRPRPPVSQSHTISAPATTAPSATISSAPQLRNLKKEAVAFLPPSVRKQMSRDKERAKMAGLGSRGVVSNPDVEEREEGGRDEEELRHENDQQDDDVRVPSPSPPPAPVPTSKAVPPKSSLVGYYDDSDEEDEDEDAAATVDQADPDNQERQERQSATTTPAPRVNLVEALKFNLPAPAKNTNAGGAEYEKYLASLGDLL